ncbi:N-acetylglucosaminyl-diphospho-decaprenol L-rhamnosyltransferase [compost metagenome]
MLSTNVQRWAHAYRSLLGDLREPTPSEPPSVSIVIPVYNKVAYTQKCLEALIANTPPQIAYEVIIVDNGSSDETSTLLSQLEGEVKVLVNERNLGFAKACNQGAATARGRYVLFLNNDTEPLPGWLEPLIQVLDDDPQVAAVGARLLYPDGTLQHAGVSVVEDLRQGLPLNCLHRYHRLPANHAPANQRADVQVVTGAALMIRGDLFHEVGGFDEGYWNGNEDVDLCFSLGQRGWRIVYEPQSCLVHHESVSGPERWRKVNENIRRLLQRWVGRIVPDELIAVDGSAQPHPARLVSRAAPASSDRVSIVLLGYNQLAYTRLCVESVLEHSDLPFELLLIDNGSVDGTGEYFKGLASRDARVKAILNPRNLGFAVGCNQGIAEATGKYVLFLNNDTIVPRQWLSRLLAHFKERPAVGAVGAVSNCVSGPQQLQTVPVPNRPEAREAILSFGEAIASSMRGKGFELGRLVGFCLMVRRDVLDRIGGFDPRFGIGNFEDDDLCLRVLTAGFRTWVAQDVYVHHFGSRTFAALGPHAFEDTMDQGWDLFKQKWGLASHLDRRQPYLVELPAFDPARHVVPTLETLPAECAEPFRPGISPLSLPDRRQVAFFHHPDWAATSWEEVVLSYARAFAPAEDVSLVLWLDPSQGVGLEEASTRVLDALTRGGLDPESIPDLLLVPDILDLEGLARLYAAVDGVVPGGDPRQAFRADQAGRPVLSALDAPAWHTMARELAEGRRSPQLDANSAELMSEAPLRSERDAPRKESPWR